METKNPLCVKIIHCGNKSIANPGDQGQKNIFYMPMGIFALADVLNRDGVEIEIIHLDLEAGKEIREILDIAALDAVGFDCHWLNQALVVMETAEMLKKIKPGLFIFLGGFTAGLFVEEIMANYPQVDAVIRGDGEKPVVQLCRALQQGGKDMEKVQNLAWRKNNSEIRYNDFSYVATAEEIENLDFAALDLLRNWRFYKSASLFYTHFPPVCTAPVFFLEVGRGCQYACTFCGGNCEAQMRMNNRDVTIFRTVDSAIKTIERAISFGYETFYTCMESENSDNWYIQLFDRLKEKNILINYCYGSWRLPPTELVEAAARACNHVIFEISPETVNIELRKKNKDMRLFYSNEDLEAFLDNASNKNNIKVQLCFGYYLASDTMETITDTIYYILELLIKYHRFLEIEYGNFSTDPGSLFFFYPEKYRLETKVRNFKDYMKYLKEYYQSKEGQPADMTLCRPGNITGKENIEITRKVMLLNYLFSSYRKSVSTILEKTGKPGIIAELLEEAGLALDPGGKFSSHQTRDMLIKGCEKEGILDVYLFQLICNECEKEKSKSGVSRPTTQLYMDLEKLNFTGDEGKDKSLLYARDKIEDEEEFDI